MDGRRALPLAWLLAVSLGCHKQEVLSDNPQAIPAADNKKILDVSTVFGKKSKAPSATPVDTLIVREPAKPGQPLKPETEIALAQAEIEAALTEGRSTVERDQLLDSARQRYQRALKVKPKDPDALLGLAKLYSKAGDKERAEATYLQAIQAYPKDHALAHRLAACRAQFGDWSGAVEACELALAGDPENRTYQKTLGVCLAGAGRWDEAFAAFCRIMSEAEARYFLGRSLYDQDKVAEARQMMESALQADPRHDLARQFLHDLDVVTRAAASHTSGIRTVSHQEPTPSAER